MKKSMALAFALAMHLVGTVTAATLDIPTGTVYTNSANYVANGTTIVVPEGAALDLRTVRNSYWYNYNYVVNLAGTGPDGLGALRDTGTMDPRYDDPQINQITLTADALIKSSRNMGLLAGGYKTTNLNLNNHTLTLDFDSQKSLSFYHSGPWSAKGTIKVVNGGISVPKVSTGFSDFESATISVEGAGSWLKVTDADSLIYVKNLLLENGAKFLGAGILGVNGGTFKPCETNAAFTGTLRVWGNITLDLTGLDGAWTFPKYDYYKCTASTVTVKPGAWAKTGSRGHRVIAWTPQTMPDSTMTFAMDSTVPADWRVVKRADGISLYPADAVYYAMRDIVGNRWKFYTLDWAEVTDSCGLAEPTDEQTVCFSSVAEFEALKQLSFSSREVLMRSCTLGADAVLDGLAFALDPSATVDLTGHRLEMPGRVLAWSVGGTITSSVAGGVLVLDVPANGNEVVKYTSLAGGANLQLWKTGAGRLSLEKIGQTFGGNNVLACVVKAGVLAKGTGTSPYWGRQYSVIQVEAGGQADLRNGKYWDYYFHIAGEGPDGKGAITATEAAAEFYKPSTSNGFLRDIVLEDDATVGGNKMWALSFYNNTAHTIAFNNHTFTVGLDNFIYWIYLTPTDAGKLVVGSVEVYQASVDMSKVDVEVRSCLASCAGNFFNPVKSLKYDPQARWYLSGTATNEVMATVLECYRPGLGEMPSVALGAPDHLTPTLDLSTQTGTLGGTNISYAAGALVTVATGMREIARDLKLVSWPNLPAGVRFKLKSDLQAPYCLEARDDGLYVAANGIAIYLR